MFQTKWSWRDLFSVVLVALAALLLLLVPFLNAEEGGTLVITTPEGAQEYSLDRDQTLRVESNGISLEIVIEDGAAFVKESDCPDGVCRASKSISKSGESILCAPAGVTLKVKGGKANADFVAG